MRRATCTILVALFVAAGLLVPAVAADAPASFEPDTDCDAVFPAEVTDATGETITLEEPPERIVALQASDAQIIYHIGAEDSLVGLAVEPAISHLDAGDRTDISDDYETDREAVVDLEPDLVLAANVTFDDDIEHLREAGLTVYQFPLELTLEDIAANVLTYGELVDECEGATASVDWMDERLSAAAETIGDADHPTAYYELGGGFTIGDATFQHQILEAGGLENIAPASGISGWEPISEEEVIAHDPDWIVYPDYEPEPPIAESLQATTAYQEGNTLGVDQNNMSQPGPNVVLVVEQIAEAVHGEEVDDATDGTVDADEADDSTPGFGVAVAIVAVLTVALARRR